MWANRCSTGIPNDTSALSAVGHELPNVGSSVKSMVINYKRSPTVFAFTTWTKDKNYKYMLLTENIYIYFFFLDFRDSVLRRPSPKTIQSETIKLLESPLQTVWGSPADTSPADTSPLNRLSNDTYTNCTPLQSHSPNYGIERRNVPIFISKADEQSAAEFGMLGRQQNGANYTPTWNMQTHELWEVRRTKTGRIQAEAWVSCALVCVGVVFIIPIHCRLPVALNFGEV